ncbi:flagellar biosynthetic protein FliR [Roseococcus pinisoli]|uniref:Flagellar biosynthetic protein FliR n=1 Tax=Roseococcus pinisoli TaxID=2835040 RepID=A0ABS5QG18_9PROT|nr:flagellar biosynthetic protein FliR [Roseococcus pinisoli]MBS7812639.1 flagellar biosynthetic protein FliR [Roseococcus pinisoli]
MSVSGEVALLAALPGLAFHAALLLCRMGAAVMLLPGVGEAEIPTTVRLALALGLVFALLPPLSPGLPDLPAEVSGLLVLIVGEVLSGVWLGGLARILVMALSQAGQVVSLMIGLASPLQGDLVPGSGMTALARMLSLATAALMLATGLFEIPLRALANSYGVLPPGGVWPGGASAEEMARTVGDSLSLAMQLAAPFLVAAIFFNAGLGLISRIAPHAQIFVLGSPAQILGGLLLMFLLLPSLLNVWARGLNEGFLRLPGID